MNDPPDNIMYNVIPHHAIISIMRRLYSFPVFSPQTFAPNKLYMNQTAKTRKGNDQEEELIISIYHNENVLFQCK